jgi:hypothetical protein
MTDRITPKAESVFPKCKWCKTELDKTLSGAGTCPHCGAMEFEGPVAREIEPFCSVSGCNNDGQHKVMNEWVCSFHLNFPHTQAAHDSFEEFMNEARELIDSRAKEKGYNEGSSEKNDLMEFTNKFFPGHAGGEIVYKAIRYGRKGDKTDLLKIAAWAYLLWRYDEK